MSVEVEALRPLVPVQPPGMFIATFDGQDHPDCSFKGGAWFGKSHQAQWVRQLPRWRQRHVQEPRQCYGESQRRLAFWLTYRVKPPRWPAPRRGAETLPRVVAEGGTQHQWVCSL